MTNFWNQLPIPYRDAAPTLDLIEGARSAAEAARDEAEAARDTLLAAVALYESRADFEAATIPDEVTQWSVLHADRVLHYVRDPAGTAIESANGVKGSPASQATVLHWGAGPAEATATNAAAFAAALAWADVVHVPNVGEYLMGADPLVISAPNKALIGERRGGGTRLRFSGPTGIRIAPPDLQDGSRVVGTQIVNLDIRGAGASATFGYAIEAVQAGGLMVQNVYFQDFACGILVRGGQSNSFRNVRGFAFPGSLIADVTGRSLFHVKHHERDAAASVPAYVVKLTDFEFGGGIPHYNVEDVILIESVDGLVMADGYANGGRRSIMHVDLTEDSAQAVVTGSQVSSVYTDCMNGTTDYAVMFSRGGDFSTAVVNGLGFANCFLGVAKEAAIYAPSNVGLNFVTFTGCQVRAASAGRAVELTGSSFVTNLSLSGCQLLGGIGSVITDVASLSISGGAISNAATNPALTLAGTMTNASLAGVAFLGNSAGDFADTATITRRAYAGLGANMAASGNRGTFVPLLRSGNDPSDATLATEAGEVRIGDGIVHFRVSIILSDKGTTTGGVRVRIPATTANDHPIPIWGSGNANAGAVALRVHDMDAAVIGAGDAIMADLLDSAGGVREIRLTRLNAFGQGAEVPGSALTDTSRIVLSGHWFF